jgi:hypothetical protein
MSVVFDVQATFKPPNAMRGGIQMCFPQVLQHHPIIHSCHSFYWIVYFSAVILILSVVYKFNGASGNCKISCSLDTLGHWSDMDLQETGYGPWMMSSHH